MYLSVVLSLFVILSSPLWMLHALLKGVLNLAEFSLLVRCCRLASVLCKYDKINKLSQSHTQPSSWLWEPLEIFLIKKPIFFHNRRSRHIGVWRYEKACPTWSYSLRPGSIPSPAMCQLLSPPHSIRDFQCHSLGPLFVDMLVLFKIGSSFFLLSTYYSHLVLFTPLAEAALRLSSLETAQLFQSPFLAIALPLEVLISVASCMSMSEKAKSLTFICPCKTVTSS